MKKSVFCLWRKCAALLMLGAGLGWVTNAGAIPPTPPAQIVLPEKFTGAAVQFSGQSLPIQIKINEDIVEIEIVAKQQTRVAGKPDFDQPAAEVLMEKRAREKDARITGHEIPLRLGKPGTYVIDIRIQGKTATGAGFSDRLRRYIVVDPNGAASMQTPEEFQRRNEKARENRFLEENKKNPKNHPIRMLFEDSVDVPAERVKIQELDVPPGQRIQVRPAGPSDFLRKHSVDHSNTSWTSHDPITVRGRLVFQDIDGVWKPLVNVSVNLWDSDILIDEHLGAVATDWDGRWSFTVNDDDGWFQDGRDIYYTFKLENTRLSTGSCGFLTGAYEWKSAVHNDLPDGTVLDFGNQTASTNMEALQVWSTLNLAWAHAVNAGGWDPGHVGSCYPAGGTFYNGSVNVEATYNDGPDVIMHEYGHALMAHAYVGGDPSPGGSHSFGQCNQNRSLSWSEGWATAFMLSARPDGRFNWHEGDSGQSIERFGSTCHIGETSEGWVAAALLDMMDANDDDNAGNQDFGRNGVSDHNSANTVALSTILRDSIVGHHHNDVSEFWNTLAGELNATQRSLAQEIMNYNWMGLAAPSSCVATKVATMKESNPEPLLAGLRRFRDLALKNWRHGRDLTNMYYRNSPEIGTLLLRNPNAIPDALRVMKHFSEMGSMIGDHNAYMRTMEKNTAFIPDDVRRSMDNVLQVLAARGSNELKRDVAALRKDLAGMKGITLLQLQERVTGAKASEANRPLPVLRQSEFTPASKAALGDPQLQEVIRKSLPDLKVQLPEIKVIKVLPNPQ